MLFRTFEVVTRLVNFSIYFPLENMDIDVCHFIFVDEKNYNGTLILFAITF